MIIRLPIVAMATGHRGVLVLTRDLDVMLERGTLTGEERADILEAMGRARELVVLDGGDRLDGGTVVVIGSIDSRAAFEYKASFLPRAGYRIDYAGAEGL